MTTLDYLEKIDDTLAHWEDYFHGQEGADVTEARANLDKVRKQLLIQRVSNCISDSGLRELYRKGYNDGFDNKADDKLATDLIDKRIYRIKKNYGC